ncbi:MAG: barstar family protein [Eubacterium sp.]|nr:barstar family protein [Eubacterium sp.]
MKTIRLDFTNLSSREEIHNLIANRLDFPDWYGANLDALYDCLTDLHDDICLEIQMPGEDAPLATYLERVRRVLQDASRETGRLSVVCVPPVPASISDVSAAEAELSFSAGTDCAAGTDQSFSDGTDNAIGTERAFSAGTDCVAGTDQSFSDGAESAAGTSDGADNSCEEDESTATWD